MIEVETLIQWYEDTVNETVNSRVLSEKDRDYYDGIQWTTAEVEVMNQRKQPVITINRIKPKVDSLIGMEIQARVDIKAFPRNPDDEQAAEAATDALRYIADNSDFDQLKTDASSNLFVEGTMSGIVEVEQTSTGFEVLPHWVPWDRFFHDPHSTKRDGTDSRYMGQAIWMDDDTAKAAFPDVDESLFTNSASTGTLGDTYDDKPRNLFYDNDRDRVRVIEIYYYDGGWKHCIFTGNGAIVDPRPSPYHDDEGQPDNPMVMQSAFVNRDNKRYGAVRTMISIQDEINKRRSKAMHLMSVRQVIADEGAVEDVNAARRELAKPDGYIKLNPNKRFDIQETGDLAQGQFALLQESKGEIDAIGANAAVTGKEERNLSGRALQVRAQAGSVEVSPMFDGIRYWEKRMYEQMWMRARQFWTEPKWIRVSDDENNLRFVGLNQPITRGDVLKQRGTWYDANDVINQQVVGVDNQVGELDVDIILAPVPDNVNLQAEQFELLANMYQANPQAIPFEMLIEVSSLRGKDRILEQLKGEQLSPEEQAAAAEKEQKMQAAAMDAYQIERSSQLADIAKTEAETVDELASAKQREADAQNKQAQALETMVMPR